MSKTLRILKIAVFCILLNTHFITYAEEEAVDYSSLIKDVEKEQIEKNTKIIEEINKNIKVTKSQIKQQQFVEAEKTFKLIQDLINEEQLFGPFYKITRGEVNSLKSELYNKWGDYIYSLARKSYLDKNYDNAIIQAKEAEKVNPKMTEQVKGFIELCHKHIKADEYVNETDLANIPSARDLQPNKDRIQIMMKQAELLYKNEKYIKVKSIMEQILVRDPYNEKAMYFLDKVYRKLYKIAKIRSDNELLERQAEVIWKWPDAVLPTEEIKPPEAGPVEANSSNTDLYERLQKIIINEIEFDDAHLIGVVQHLNTISKQRDPDNKGVGIFLKLNPEEVETLPRVNMSFDNIPLAEVIRYLCQGVGLKYRVEENAVIIGKANIDEMDRRFFKVRAALISSLLGTSEEGSDSAESDIFESEDLMDSAKMDTEVKAGPTASATSATLMKYFSDRGVPFPEGSTIAYDRRSGKLIVKNLPENLRRLEALLRDLDIVTPLVLIEAKIVEISQDDLRELGFDWVFSKEGVDVGNGQESWIIQPTEKILRSLGGQSSSTTDPSDGIDRLLNNAIILPNFGPGNRRNLTLTINAIDQSGRGEVLSAPKVIATSGTTATLRMVQEEYFPESWTDPEISTSENFTNYTPSYPEFGDATDVGVRFEVTPTVSPNNYTISLDLNPQIISLAGWTDYSYPIVIGGDSPQSTLINVRMPELGRRDLSANVKVYDGETVVLGGMLREETSLRDDKFPILGDIPIVGRLFRSQLNRSLKRNLLIFVTARLVSGDGVPVRRDTVTGVPDFLH